MTRSSEAIRVHYRAGGASQAVADALHAVLSRRRRASSPLVFLCVGTDRSTGDALGPLVGQALLERGVAAGRVFGTLDQPAHAGNLEEVAARIQRDVQDAFVIAVDACLGRMENVGTVTVGAGALCPGAGVNKDLPEVGGAFITGTVNVGGFMEYFVLQNTRLNLVMGMAEVIASSLASLDERLAAAEGSEAAATSLPW